MRQDRRTTTAWVMQLAVCRTEPEVIRVANAYLATWLPSDFELLPPQCRVSAIADADELANAAVALTQCELQAVPGTMAGEILASLSEVFIAAQSRIRQLRSSRYDPAAA
jgi:hypothetical protein